MVHDEEITNDRGVLAALEIDQVPHRLVVRASGYLDWQPETLQRDGFVRIEDEAVRHGLRGTHSDWIALARELEPGVNADAVYDRIDWVMQAVFGASVGYEPTVKWVGYGRTPMSRLTRLVILGLIVASLVAMAGYFLMVSGVVQLKG